MPLRPHHSASSCLALLLIPIFLLSPCRASSQSESQPPTQSGAGTASDPQASKATRTPNDSQQSVDSQVSTGAQVSKDTQESKDIDPTHPLVQSAEESQVSRLSSAFRGFNAGLTIAGVHDSVVGWSTLATPSVGYSFNDVFSVDATLPIYMYRLAESIAARPRANQLLVNQRGELGDLILGMHAQFLPALFQYQATIAVTAPSGDEAYGLTTGRATFDLNNHFERTFGRLTPTLELGVGDSSTLVNRLVNKNYTSLGPLAHFQIGLGIDLPHRVSFETDAYEQLPIGDQKIYGPSRKGRPTIVTGHNVTEDNGFTNSLELPLDRHTALSAYYSRSLRFHIDSVAFAITYILRAPPPPEQSLDDLFR